MPPSIPPKDIAPAELFESWLPAEYRRLREAGELEGTPPDGSVAVTVTGDGGGSWVLAMTGGELKVAPGGGEGAQIAVEQTIDDFRALLSGDMAPAGAGGGGAGGGGGGGMRGLDILLGGGAAQQLQALKGTLRFELPGFQGRTWALQVVFGGQAEPTATISIDADTYQQIVTGALPAPQAYFSGKIAVTGDVTLAMQAGMALMAGQSM